TGAGLRGQANPQGEVKAEFREVRTDTRALSPGCLFVALVGERFDGHAYLAQAAAGGARGAVVASGRPRADVPAGFTLFEVADTLTALGELGRAHRRRFHFPL